MAMTAGQFFLYLLIIIILRESLASAASDDATEDSVEVSVIPAVNTEVVSEFYPLHGCQAVEGSLESEVEGIKGACDCEPDFFKLQRLVNRPKYTTSSLRIDFRSLRSPFVVWSGR